ncbi:MAG: DUF1788 domain-containing protein [Fibrobacterota bacterium]|nr:DUF1788 domain-containing protein [Fibrobacterota bacterium]
MNRIEELAKRFGNHVSAPWQKNLAGEQKTLMVIYPKEDERRLRVLLGLFEEKSKSAGHPWQEFDCTRLFAEWMSSQEYRESYFEEPDSLSLALKSAFRPYVVQRIRASLQSQSADENTVIALTGLGSLFGFVHISEVLREVSGCIRGRLAVFFPGDYENHSYRFLDARDGWNYMAIPITTTSGMFDI